MAQNGNRECKKLVRHEPPARLKDNLRGLKEEKKSADYNQNP